LTVRGLTNKEMAQKLAISEQTVKNHMRNIFEKLGFSDRLQLALYVVNNQKETSALPDPRKAGA
jgi:two-component system nitrate/nitrite response regulator NarL